jgi:alginate O-acetyltransferase complex protein AlgI
VLFNTLAFAKFFLVVFLVAWLLVARRATLLLPWLAVGVTVALASPGPGSVAVAASALVLSLGLCRLHREDDRPSPRLAVASVAVNFLALAWLTFRMAGKDPVGLGLAAIRAPLGSSRVWVGLGLVLGPLLLYWLVRTRKVRMVFILCASYVFYAHWDWRFLPLIWGSSTIDWSLGRAIGRAQTPRARKQWLIGTVVVNLTILGVFKYFNFGVDTARAVLESCGLHPPEIALRVALPVGISFFTFESMSYVVDVYRGVLEPKWSYFEYLSFVAFFPHLVAGPIVRPRDLLPQLAGEARWNPAEASEALFLIATGLLKKVAIGDYLATNLVERVFDGPVQYSALECYAGVLGYGVQIYTDFSGYTDIAIGAALLLGVRMPLNFNSPYKATNIQDFWHRWHISLSSWLRDYLYIALGGNRKGRIRTYVNLMLTMLLGGLWHGANWTFVAWGGMHGAGLALTRWYQEWRKRKGRRPSQSWLLRILCVAGTFHLVHAAWIFFRAGTFQQARIFFAQLGTLTTHHANLPPMVVAVLLLGMVAHWTPEKWYLGAQQSFMRAPAQAQGVALFAVALVLRQMASAQAVPFVYFQF